jgi:hypothetical protein
MTELQCNWCGEPVDPSDGYRLYEAERRAAFCRLEHVVPWQIQGPSWEPGDEFEVEGDCVECGEPAKVLLVRHRGPHRIPDAFCSVQHAADWAKAGGRWR